MNRSLERLSLAKSHSTHDNCVIRWNEQRYKDNQPNPIVKRNRQFYEHRIKKQKHQNSRSFFDRYRQDNLKEDPEEISFSNKKDEPPSKKASKTPKREVEGQGKDLWRHKEIEDIIKIEGEGLGTSNKKSNSKASYLDSLNQDRFLSSTIKKYNDDVVIKPILSSKPYLNKSLKSNYQSHRTINYPKTSRTMTYGNNDLRSYTNEASNPLTPLKSMKSSVRFESSDSIMNKSMEGGSVARKMKPFETQRQINISVSKSELKSILRNHQEELINFIVKLVEKE